MPSLYRLLARQAEPFQCHFRKTQDGTRMVEPGAAGVDHQRVAELLAKYLMGMPDQQHIMPESLQMPQ